MEMKLTLDGIFVKTKCSHVGPALWWTFHTWSAELLSLFIYLFISANIPIWFQYPYFNRYLLKTMFIKTKMSQCLQRGP